MPTAARDGDREAAVRRELEAVFRRHYRSIVRTVCAFGVASADADDVAQEVFVVAFKKWSERPTEASEGGWLAGVARGVCANHRRARRRAAARLEHADAPVQTPAPDTEVERRNAAELLQRFLGELPEHHRDAFVLYEMQGMTAPEVGEALELGTTTVHAYVRRARAKLERLIAQQHARQQRDRTGD